MYTPLVSERVRVGNSADQFIVVRVDLAARVADLRSLSVLAALETDVPLRLLFADREFKPLQYGSSRSQDNLDAARDRLRSSRVQINGTLLQIADLQASLRATVDVIRASQRLIHASDQLIARARTLNSN